MCSRFSLISPPDTLRAFLGYAGRPNVPPRYNIAPAQAIAIVRAGETGRHELALVRWGLIPSWVKDPDDFATLINARAETAADKPSFRAAMRHGRCLVPADGFIEWTGPKGRKRPFFIRRRDGAPMAFAGIREHWQGRDGSEIESAAILTTHANATLRPLHDRMPVLLDPEQFDGWLDCKRVPLAEVAGWLAPAPDDLLEAVEISPRINNPALDEPGLLEPLRGAAA